MKIECYLVLNKKRGKEPRAVRVTQGKPSLAADEALVRLCLDVPNEVFDAPMITLPVTRRNVAVAVEVDEL